MSKVNYTRQTDIVDPEAAKALHVTVCGLGTVGSHAAVELARMGVGSLHLIDGDVVEAHNMPSQAFNVQDIDRAKAEACAERVRDVSDHVQIRAEQSMLQGGEVFDAGPVVMAVDSMDARKAILELSLAWRPSYPLVIDGRMAGQALQLYAFDPSHGPSLERWLQEWFPADEALPVACGGRSVSYIGAFMGSLIAATVQKHLAQEPIPFFTMTDLKTLQVVKVKALT